MVLRRTMPCSVRRCLATSSACRVEACSLDLSPRPISRATNRVRKLDRARAEHAGAHVSRQADGRADEEGAVALDGASVLCGDLHRVQAEAEAIADADVHAVDSELGVDAD